MEKRHFVFFDLARVLLILLVIDAHFETSFIKANLTPFFYFAWYAVPLFIVMSFFLNAKYYCGSNFSKKVVTKKIARLFYPLIFWSIIGFILAPSLFNLNHLLRQFLFGTVVDTPLYYLNMMIFFSAFCFLINLALKKYSIWFYIILLMLSLIIEQSGMDKSIIHHVPDKAQYFMLRLIEFSKYVMLGLLMPSLLNISKKISHATPILFGVSVIMIIYDIRNQLMSHQDKIIYSGLVQFAVTMLITICIYQIENREISRNFKRIVKYLAKYVLGVYCTHSFFVENISKVVPNYFLTNQTSHYLFVVLIFVFSFSLVFLIDKISLGRLSMMVA